MERIDDPSDAYKEAAWAEAAIGELGAQDRQCLEQDAQELKVKKKLRRGIEEAFDHAAESGASNSPTKGLKAKFLRTDGRARFWER